MPHRKRLRQVAVYLALANMVAGLTVIAGWQFRIPLLKGSAFGTYVAPNTALCFVLCGASILMQLREGTAWRRAGAIAGALVAAFAAATLAEHFFGVNLGIDTLFMAHRLDDWTLLNPGRFVINTAVGFTLAGLSLVTLRWVEHRVSEFFALLILLVSYLSLVGFVYGAAALYDRVMAVHTAVLFGVLATGLLCAAARQAVLNVVFGPFAGAIASRRMIMAVVLLLPAMGLVNLWAGKTGLMSPNFGAALSVVATVTVFTLLALSTAAKLNETDRRRVATEQALLRSRQIEAAGRMAASVAHEINNPLEAIGNIIYLLKSDTLPAEMRRKYLTFAEEELGRVAALARRTLGFYKEETSPVELSFPELIDSVLEIYEKKLASGTAVRKLYADEARIRARAGEIRQVIANLVANAIDAMPAEGALLEIGARTVGDDVVVEVRDNGHGIAGDDLDRIFEPLFSTKKERGTGLGLWVSKDLVTKNGGDVSVASSTRKGEQGTTFRLRFPAARHAPGAKAAQG